MQLYNTLTKKIESISLESPVGIYVCGITVYDDCHIGHARTIIFFDVLQRYLLYKGMTIHYIQNFTDVDDKIINKAIREKKKFDEISSLYIDNYFRDFDKLNVKHAERYPRATEHIMEMIGLIEQLISKDKAYVTSKGVYFSIRSFPEYGKLSNKSIEQLEAGSRIEIDPDKKDPLDFALWKFSDSEPYWSSPWGKGRPGWHIECSAMAMKYLNGKLDIHGGGHDLIFPHHENEIAQSESFSEKIFAKIWMHVGMVTINGEKMSKSLGNITRVDEALKAWSPNVLRLFCLSVHYTKPLDYAEKNLVESLNKWRLIENCIYELRYFVNKKIAEYESSLFDTLCQSTKKDFENALEQDMNITAAISVLMRFVNSITNIINNTDISQDDAKRALDHFQVFFDILGIKIYQPSSDVIEAIENLISIRNRCREEKNYTASDDIRRKILEEYGVELIDHKKRTIWKKVEQYKHLI